MIFISYKNDSQRHISVGHSNIGNSSLVEDGEIIAAKSDILRMHFTYRSGSFVSVAQGTS